MSFSVAVTIVIVSLALVAGAVWAWHHATRQSRTFRRLAPALVEWEALEKLLAYRSDRSHFLERHGPMTHEEEQQGRALTGILAVAGVDGRPVDAGRWRRHRDLLTALDYANAQWVAGVRPPRGVFRLRFPEAIGDGFAAGSETLVATTHVLVIVRTGVAIIVFPVVVPDPSVAWESVQTSRVPGLACLVHGAPTPDERSTSASVAPRRGRRARPPRLPCPTQSPCAGFSSWLRKPAA